MYDLQTLQAMNRDAALRAAIAKRIPYVVEKEDINAMPPFLFPNLGDYRPKGWKLVEEYFIDSSGFGAEGEPALTINQFKAKLFSNYQTRELGEPAWGECHTGQFPEYALLFREGR